MMNEAGSENLADDADPKASPDAAAEKGAKQAGPEKPGAGPAEDVTPPEKASEASESPKDESPPAPVQETPTDEAQAEQPAEDVSVPPDAPAGEPPVAEGPADVAAATQTAESDAKEEAGEKAKESVEDEAAPAKEKAEEPTEEIDLEAVANELDEKRDRLVTELFGEYRPHAAAAQKALEGFTGTLQTLVAAGRECAGEAAKLVQAGCQRHEEALSAEKAKLQQHAERVIECTACYENLFTELDVLVEQVGKELEPLDPDSEQYKAAPEELRDRLANYRKGVEIIHRMFSRVKDRRKELAQDLPALATNGLDPAEPPAEVDKLDAYVRELSTKFHDLRDANDNTLREAEEVGAKCWKATVHVVKGVISAVDGIDGGLQNEPDTRAALKQFETEKQEITELIDCWFQAYHRLQEHVEAFFAKTGIESHTVEPGTPFDPETMEPQSTVESSELNEEDVAAVARRGFSLKGEPVRPVMVDVVKNK
jgi:molecular chaperone GrpE (heat shock protein)